MPKLEPYRKELSYSYALGIFPAMHLLETRPEVATRLLLHPAGLKSEGVNKLREKCAALGIREEEAERVLRRESKKDNCFAALVFEKYEDPLPPENCAVFCQISDAGNLGTALRALLGFGLHSVALIRPCVDRFDPHVVRASMGAFFRMRVHVYDKFEDYRSECGPRELYPFMLDGAKPLGEVAAKRGEPYSMIFGNEAAGLPKDLEDFGNGVIIPHSDKIDSLNLAVAAGIGLYAFSAGARQGA